MCLLHTKIEASKVEFPYEIYTKSIRSKVSLENETSKVEFPSLADFYGFEAISERKH